MKIIRPEQPIKKKEENHILGKDDKTVWVEEMPQTIEEVMQEVLTTDKNITFTVTLTKRQYEIYVQKGGEKWLKKKLTGQLNIRKKK